MKQPQEGSWFVLVGGINGAGKSTFSQDPETLRELLGLSVGDKIEVINPDLVTRRVVAERSPELSLEQANKRAADECEADVRDRIERRAGHFVIETVLSSDKYKPIVERAHQRGWQVLLVYVALNNVDEAIARVAHRVEMGGHDVPTEKIRSRWPRSLGNVTWFWRRSDAALLVLNLPNFEAPVELARKQRGWTKIYEQAVWPHAVAPVLLALADACGFRCELADIEPTPNVPASPRKPG